MIGTDTIYGLANRDARTGSVPKRLNDGSYQFSNGQAVILNDENYSGIKQYVDEVKTLSRHRYEACKYMLSKESVLKKELLRGDAELTKAEEEYKEAVAQLNLTQEEVGREQERLLARGYNVPEQPRMKRKHQEPDRKSKTRSRGIVWDWRGIKRWTWVFIVIVILETFFGLALWDSLRDQKSIVQVALRIAASGLLVVSLHLAEHKYKKSGKWIYGLYIIYGIISLILLLIGSLVIGYFFPEYLEGTSTTNFDFDLNSSQGGPIHSSRKGFVGFFMRYDFIIGIINILIYMLIHFLDTGKTKAESKPREIAGAKQTTVFAQINFLYSRLENDNLELSLAIQRYDYLKNQPSKLLLEIQTNLKDTKNKIEDIELQLLDKRNLVELLLRQLESNLKQYHVDFTDVFNSKLATTCVSVPMVDRKDLKTFYKII